MEPGQPVGRPLLERSGRQPLVERMAPGAVGLDGRQPQSCVGLGPERRRGGDPLPGDVVGVAGLPSTRRQLAKVPERTTRHGGTPNDLQVGRAMSEADDA
jgi:hypothetical protein